MPALLMNGQKSPKEEAVEILHHMTATSWKADRGRVLKLLEAA